MKYLFILNDPPYGTERSYNGLRLAKQLVKEKDTANEVHVFLLGDAVVCAKHGQSVPQGYYHLESFLKMLVRRKSQVGVCGACIDARGIAATELIKSVHRSTMDELAQWTDWADKVMIF